MKAVKVPFVIWCFVMAFAASAQSEEDVVNKVMETLKTASVGELSKFLHDYVDIELEGRKENYSRAQSEFIFRSFFKSHAPSDVILIQKGQSKNGHLYAICRYKSEGDSYRVFMEFKSIADQQLVHAISFSQE